MSPPSPESSQPFIQAVPGGLASGRHGIPRELVERRQRGRVFAAVALVVSEHGYAELTTKKVIRAAGISSATFYELFDDKRQVVVAAYDAISAHLLAEIEAACATQPDWPAKVEAAIAVAVGFAVAEPECARLLCVGALVVRDDRVLDVRERLAVMLSSGRRGNSHAEALPSLAERALVAAIWSMIDRELFNDEPAGLAKLRPELVELALVLYFGREEAARMEVGSDQ